MKQNSLEKFSEIMTSIEFMSHELRKNIEVFRCKVNLIDKSNLRIQEKYQYNELVYYSYYWLTSNNQLIIGWDRAPHHTHLKTFPHHKHLSGKEKPVESDERNLADVLAYIAKRLEV